MDLDLPYLRTWGVANGVLLIYSGFIRVALLVSLDAINFVNMWVLEAQQSQEADGSKCPTPLLVYLT